MVKVVIVSGLLPSGHYTENLASGLNKIKKLQLLIYTDLRKENLKVKKSGKVIPVWSKSPMYIFQILGRLLKDRPDVVHFQHEINMFGGLTTAIIFPFMLVAAKLLKIKVATTVHATVSPNQIDSGFVKTFNQNPKIIKPVFLKLFFSFLYKSICQFSDLCFVHTKTAKQVLLSYYPNGKNKIKVIATAIPLVSRKKSKKKKYFLYFGYIARRKGLENLIEGFKKFSKKNPKSKFKLLLAGGVIKGQEESLLELQKIIAKAKLKNKIKYLGFLEKEAQTKLYKQAYGVVIPAKLSISASGPLYHAFSHGKFIMASNIGHLKDEIANLHNGYLIPNNGWSHGFSRAIKSPNWVRKIELNSVNTAKQRTPLKTAMKYFKSYNLLITKNV